MRALICFLLCAAGCRSQTPAEQVLAVYRQMEKAEQRGDFDTWVGLWSRESASDAGKLRPYARPRPDRHYTSSKVFVQGDQAVLLGQSGKDQFLRMRFVKEDGRWKIQDQIFAETAYHPDSVYAAIPAAAGAFERAGSPWRNAASAFDPADRRGWGVRAVYDESYLYVRIESSSPLPPPGSQLEKPPGGWPVMKAAVSGVGEFILRASANIGDQATFDSNGRANSHRHFVSYLLWVEHSGQSIFEANSDLTSNPLVQVAEHSFDLRVPLRAMGIADARHITITIGDAQWPKSAIFSLAVTRFP